MTHRSVRTRLTVGAVGLLLALPAAATAEAIAQIRGLHDPVLVPLLDASRDPRPES